MNRARLLESVKRHEGYRAEPYKDSLGYWTAGYGHLVHNLQLSASPWRNLGDLLNWISDPATHDAWLESDLAAAESDARRWIGDTWDRLSDARQEVITEMAFQLGSDRLSGFREFRAAILAGDWSRASEEMMDSLWARQTPSRARSLAEKFLAG